MYIRTSSLAIDILVIASLGVLAAGCDRQESKTDSSAMTTPGTPPPPASPRTQADQAVDPAQSPPVGSQTPSK